MGAQQASAWGREGPGSRRVRGRQRKAAIGGPPGFKPGEARAGGRRGVGREVGVGGGGAVGGGVRRRIALQCALNKGGHLDLIGSNTLFSDPICLSPAKFGGQRRPIVGPSSCKSIPVRVLIIADVNGGIRAVGGPPTMKRRGPAAGKANKTAAPHPPANVNRPECHNIFPHRPTIPGNLFRKGKEKGGENSINKQAQSAEFISSKWKDVYNLFLKPSLSRQHKLIRCLFPIRGFLLNMKNGAVANV